MAHALRLAARALGRTHPNPTVGCVLTRQGKVVGRGWHHKAGMPHAEVEAMASCDPQQVRGSTAYVTLEPCSHHGRTPPCCEALIQAGVARVVVAMLDPNPLVAGRGIARLQEAGIPVTLGVLEKEAAALVRPFVTWITHKRPMVTLKAAASLDGKIATRSGESQWITGPLARQKVQRLRDTHDLVMVGIGTVLADDPQLNCRLAGGRDPIRLVVDSHLRLPLNARILSSSTTAPLWLATTQAGMEEQFRKLEHLKGVKLLLCEEDEQGRVNLPHLLQLLADQGITSILSEAGGRLSSSLLEHHLVDRLALFLAPRLIGGQQAAGILNGAGVASLLQTPYLQSWHSQRLGEDLFITGDLSYEQKG
ncbi:MAG: bifunctional diaminohydroxyphosphoribosylaminopyrimidine deaminase/5-amino-6-(5-phosphoribosylamino)uracil reductase RibD [Magnetococcales bacterium]|nr:bifunctional diaminohydroxyphosphoribosylaminopyrimidine deaminase/5-amino-6-(5-phosphoribosylamino)uracil reductase RibD [Magnetococcales bacterium]NGZ26660.1 bifunctional diaminohydroxyphosphoribosylaminopyrimidine deaminase/5-amino-6-(5-phosphoribosylamino)uracil reductase RibD [Magnetococcales bacterium]